MPPEGDEQPDINRDQPDNEEGVASPPPAEVEMMPDQIGMGQVLQSTLFQMLQVNPFVSKEEIFDKLNLDGSEYTSGTFSGNTNLTSRGPTETMWIGENAEEPFNLIRKTTYISPHRDNRQRMGFCLKSFDDEIETNQEFIDRIYNFEEESWNQTMRAKGSVTIIERGLIETLEPAEAEEPEVNQQPSSTVEIIEQILYRDITKSDYKTMLGLRIAEGGSSDTHIDLPNGPFPAPDLRYFATGGEIRQYKRPEPDFTNFPTHALQVYRVGSGFDLQNPANRVRPYYHLPSEGPQVMYFEPKWSGLRYRISLQADPNTHPAWKIEHGFPAPPKEGEEYIKYTNEANDSALEEIVENLTIYIIKTNFRRYFAGFVDSAEIPESWPKDVGLEAIFRSETKNGILTIGRFGLEYIDNATNPFGQRVENYRKDGGKNILLYGVPGSGKSWTIENKYREEDDVVERVVFHPDYTYSDFIGQILPFVSGDGGTVSYRFQPGPFTKVLRDATQNPAMKYILIIEEVNRGNAPAIFGDIFQLLDRKTEANDNGWPLGSSEYGITNADIAKVVYGSETEEVKIPSNLWLLGTMNTSDQNVFTLDTAFQRRWKMKMIDNRFETTHGFADENIRDTDLTWKKFCTTINETIVGSSTGMASTEDKRLGKYFVQKKDLEGDGFAEKVIKYLWDDAFKFNQSEVFDKSRFPTLEEVIREFNERVENKRLVIFNEELKTKLDPESAGE